MIDESGNVIFHSNRQKSMNENFLDECEGNPFITAAIKARSKTNIDVNYSLKPTKIFIRPIEGLPYFLVTFTDEEQIDNVHSEVFGISMILEIGLLFIYLCIALTIYITGTRKSYLKIPRFNFFFLLPKLENKSRYLQSTLFNSFHILLLLFFSMNNAEPVLLLFVFFTGPIYTVALNYFILADEHQLQVANRKIIRIRLYFGVAILSVINFSALNYLDHPVKLFVYQVLLGLFYFAILFFRKRREDQPVDLEQGKKKISDHHFNYMLMVYSIVILICVLPVIRFGVLTYNKECEITVKSTQLNMADTYSKRIDFLSGNDPQKNINVESMNRGNYTAPFYGTQISEIIAATDPASKEEKCYDSIHSKLRASIQGAEIQNGEFGFGAKDSTWSWGITHDRNLQLKINEPEIITQPKENNFFFFPFAASSRFRKNGLESFIDEFNSTLRLPVKGIGSVDGRSVISGDWTKTVYGNLLSQNVGQESMNQPLAFASGLHTFHFPQGTFLYASKFWLLFLLLLFLLYYLLRFFVRKLFALEAFEEKKFKELDLKFFKETNPEFRIFVTGLPCSGKSRYFTELYCSQENYYLIDLIASCDVEDWKRKIAPALGNGKGILLIDHFEYDCLNAKTNLLKLELLETLSQNPNIRVVIISAIHPQAFLELYTTPGVTEQSLEGNVNLHTGDRWNKALSCFYNLWFPIQGVEKNEVTASNEIPTENQDALNQAKEETLEELIPTIPERLREIIRSECDNGFFLRKIGVELCKELREEFKNENNEESGKRNIREEEDIVLKIKKIAHVYYLAIWSSLTKEEQYVLFDLAQDGLVNAKNLDIIDTLICKGLVVHTDYLLFMNKSFRNFIMSVIEPGDMMKMEQSERDAGNWDKFKKPMLVIVITLVVFVLQSDHSTYFTYITGFAAGVPLIIGLISAFGKFGVRKE